MTPKPRKIATRNGKPAWQGWTPEKRAKPAVTMKQWLERRRHR